ncbi:MAG: GGDEF domain-containing protein [Clostridia bacterium]|nr:GGDEF domain-containing protein [Clostridia bacterium]
MKHGSAFAEKMKNHLLYGGISREDYLQVRKPVGEANHKSLTYWSILVCFFWIYCLLMSLKAEDYAMCRPAYAVSLGLCVFSFLCSRFVVSRFPDTLSVFKFIFRLSLLGGGVGIAVCQWNLRSLTMFAVAIISPSIFIDSTLSSLLVHFSALLLYIFMGRNTISPEIYSWGLANYILFSVFGLLIGNAINKERFERYVLAESEKKLLEEQKRYAAYDQLTGLKNRRSYEEKLLELAENAPEEFCIILTDINGLKKANDTIGHVAGDELIIGAAECLTKAFEGIDTIYRTGGDEFSIVMTGPMEKAEHSFARLEEVLSQWKGRYNSEISISYGAASNRDHGDIESIIIEADKKMYEYKRNYYMSRGFDRRRR